MIRIVIVAILSIVEEIELQGFCRGADAFLNLRNGTQLFNSIVTILCCIHHGWGVGLESPAYTDVGIDACCHRMTTFGFNQDDAIGTTGTIESRCILQHGHLVNVLW